MLRASGTQSSSSSASVQGRLTAGRGWSTSQEWPLCARAILSPIRTTTHGSASCSLEARGWRTRAQGRDPQRRLQGQSTTVLAKTLAGSQATECIQEHRESSQGLLQPSSPPAGGSDSLGRQCWRGGVRATAERPASPAVLSGSAVPWPWRAPVTHSTRALVSSAQERLLPSLSAGR